MVKTNLMKFVMDPVKLISVHFLLDANEVENSEKTDLFLVGSFLNLRKFYIKKNFDIYQ